MASSVRLSHVTPVAPPLRRSCSNMERGRKELPGTPRRPSRARSQGEDHHRLSTTGFQTVQWRRMVDENTLCLPKLHGRHCFFLEVACKGSRARTTIRRSWLAWAIVFGWYTDAEVTLTMLPSAVATATQHALDKEQAEAHSNYVHLDLRAPTAVSDALKKIESDLNDCEHSKAGDSFRILLSSGDLNVQDQILTERAPVSLFCLVSRHTLHMMVSLDRRFATERQGDQLLGQFYGVFNGLLRPNSASGFFGSQYISHQDIETFRRWNSFVPRYSPECVDQLIAMQTDKHPTMQAICAWDGSLTYSQLDVLTSALAAVLIEQGVTTEVIVPICFEKSAYAIVALLAVCKAGGAFAMLDPAQPFSRLKSLLEQLNPKICLTSAAQDTAWKSSQEMAVYNTLQVTESLLDSLPKRKVRIKWTTKPHHACYIVFTSGSTAQPKGVVIEHRNVVAFSHACKKPVRIETIPTQSRVLQFASYAFDASIQETLVSLTLGACICVPSEESCKNDLAGAINSLRANHVTLTASVLKVISPIQVPKLQTLLLVGEPLNSAIIDEWANAVHLVNGYGPSECTIGSAFNPHVTRETHFANIGRPVACVGWVVDPMNADALLPLGAVGELLLEGPNVGRGYLNDPVKTNSVFIETTAWMKDFRLGRGHRLYKTGDLVRYASDGSISFVGRRDSQVKIRGQRVELAEVEVQLRRAHTNIQDAIAEVIVPAGDQTYPILVAFISCRNTDVLTGTEYRRMVDEIQQTMAARLPKHMIPSVVLRLSSLPLLVSGKTDRKALRNMASSKTLPELLRNYRSRGSMETELPLKESLMRRLWSGVLGLEEKTIPPNVSFFQLGGDSIRAMLLSKEARSAGYNLPVKEIFNNPCLLEIAQGLVALDLTEKKLGHDTPETPPDFNDNWQKEQTQQFKAVEMPVTESQEDAITQSMLPSRGALVFISLKFHGLLDVQKLQKACCLLPQRHEVLRTSFTIRKGRLWSAVQKQFQPDFEIHTLPKTRNEVDMLHDIYRAESKDCDPLQGPVLKFILLKYHSNCCQLIIRMCHATFDGISTERIRTDIYNEYLGLGHTPCPDFRDYQIAASLQHTAYAYKYWRELLQGASMTQVVTRTKPDYVHPANCTLSRTVSIEPVRVDSTDVTMATVVKATWALVLAQLTGQQDVVFGCLGSGRNVPMPDVSEVVGQCITDVPVRVHLKSLRTVADLLLLVHHQYLQTLCFETIGFLEIVRRCTKWPQWTRLSSYVQFQNVQVDDAFSLGPDISCESNKYEAPIDAADLYVMVTPGQSRLNVELSFSKNIIPESTGQHVLDQFCTYIECLCNPALELQELLHHKAPGILFPIQHDGGFRNQVKPLSLSSIPGNILRELQQKISHAWSDAFGSESTPETPLGLEENLFDLGGNFPRLVYLMACLRKQGFEVTIEELVDLPTVKAQIALLAQKMGVQTG